MPRYGRRRYRRRRGARYVTRRTFRRALVSRPPVEIKVASASIGSDYWRTERKNASTGQPWIAITEPVEISQGDADNQRVGNKINLKNWQLRFFVDHNSMCTDVEQLGGDTKYFMALVVMKPGISFTNIGEPTVQMFFENFALAGATTPGLGGWGPFARRRDPAASDYKVLWEKWYPRDFPSAMKSLRQTFWRSDNVELANASCMPLALNFKLKNALWNYDYTESGLGTKPDYDRIFFIVIGHKPNTPGLTDIALLCKDPTQWDDVQNNWVYSSMYYRDA